MQRRCYFRLSLVNLFEYFSIRILQLLNQRLLEIRLQILMAALHRQPLQLVFLVFPVQLHLNHLDRLLNALLSHLHHVIKLLQLFLNMLIHLFHKLLLLLLFTLLLQAFLHLGEVDFALHEFQQSHLDALSFDVAT